MINSFSRKGFVQAIVVGIVQKSLKVENGEESRNKDRRKERKRKKGERNERKKTRREEGTKERVLKKGLI